MDNQESLQDTASTEAEIKKEDRIWDRTRGNRKMEATEYINEYLEASHLIDDDKK